MPIQKGPAQAGPFCFWRPIQAAASVVGIARIEQPVEMDNNIAHLGIVHGALGIGAPHLLSLRVIGKHADQIERAEIGKFEGLRIAYATAHN